MRKVAALALLAVMALAGCSSTPPARTAVVSADGITFNDGSGTTPTTVSFDLPPEKFVDRLTAILGKPTQTRDAAPDDRGWENLAWGGLGVFTGFGDIARSAIHVDSAEVRGYTITTTGGYQVGKPFPSLGAEGSCALGDSGRHNTLPDSSGDRSVTLVTGTDANGATTTVVGGFFSPLFVEGC